MSKDDSLKININKLKDISNAFRITGNVIVSKELLGIAIEIDDHINSLNENIRDIIFDKCIMIEDTYRKTVEKYLT